MRIKNKAYVITRADLHMHVHCNMQNATRLCLHCMAALRTSFWWMIVAFSSVEQYFNEGTMFRMVSRNVLSAFGIKNFFPEQHQDFLHQYNQYLHF